MLNCPNVIWLAYTENSVGINVSDTFLSTEHLRFVSIYLFVVVQSLMLENNTSKIIKFMGVQPFGLLVLHWVKEQMFWADLFVTAE